MKVRKGTSKAPTKLVLHNIRTFRNNSEQVKKKSFNRKQKAKHTTKSRKKQRRNIKKKK